MPVVRTEEIPWRELVPGVFQRPLVSQETGAVSTLMGEVRLDPGAVLPWHYHDVEDIVLVQGGDGRIQIEDGEFPLRAGMNFIIPAGVRHRLRNEGTEPVRIIFSFPSAQPGRFWG